MNHPAPSEPSAGGQNAQQPIKQLNFSAFRAISCVVLGALTALLISLPLSNPEHGTGTVLFPIAFTLLGGLLGYRKRASSFFFYFCLVAVVVLAGLVSNNIVVSK